MLLYTFILPEANRNITYQSLAQQENSCQEVHKVLFRDFGILQVMRRVQIDEIKISFGVSQNWDQVSIAPMSMQLSPGFVSLAESLGPCLCKEQNVCMY